MCLCFVSYMGWLLPDKCLLLAKELVVLRIAGRKVFMEAMQAGTMNSYFKIIE